MSFIIDLPTEVEARLQEEALRQGVPEGVPATDIARRLIEENLPAPTWGAAILAELEADDALGLWQDRPETSEELAAKFQAEAQRPGPLPCV